MKKIILSFISLLLVFGLANVTKADVNPVTPSTNDINRTNGWAYVDQIGQGVGTTDLTFTSTRAFYSCFEYRTDGDTSQKTSPTNYNTLVTDGLYPYYCQKNSSSTHTISADEYVEVRMVFGAETDERFDWTRFDVIPAITIPTITGFLNPTLSCGAITNIHSTTVDWTDSTGGSGGIKGYDYAINYPLPNGSGQANWNTFIVPSQYTGTLNEGIHTIKVRGRDNANNVSEWSNECSITTDWTSPDVEITNPIDGTISGIVDIRGSVTDLHPHHYWLAIYNSANVLVAGPGTVNDVSSFTDKSLMLWNTTLVPDGEYIIKLEARDAVNNKDTGSVDWHTVTVHNTPNNKDECKNNGWKLFLNPVFKNQGQCVSYIESNDHASKRD